MTAQSIVHFLSTANGSRLLGFHAVFAHSLRLLCFFCFSGAALFPGLFLGLAAGPTTSKAQIPYTTGFESPPFNSTTATVTSPFVTDNLVGPGRWSGYNATGTGATGVITTGLGTGQAAYIGYHLPANAASTIVVTWKPINIDPVANGTPLIRFSVDFKVVGSTLPYTDDFFFSFYNSHGERICGMDIDSRNGRLFDPASGTPATGSLGTIYNPLTLSVTHTLVIDVNFSTRKWLAVIDGQWVFRPMNLLASATAFNLADVDPEWARGDFDIYNQPTDQWGNNYMIFDNFSITTVPVPALSITRTGTDTVALSWPAAASTGWTLQKTSQLAPVTNWTDVTTQPTVVGGQNQVTVTLSSSDSLMLFRLIHP